MTERIRWHDAEDGEATGRVGSLSQPVFRIWTPEEDGGEWLLTAALPAMEGKRYYGTPGELKAEAEQWLERFVVSLGASFPDDDDAVFDERPTGAAFEALYAPGRRVRFAHTDHGYPADQKMAADILTLGEVYTIEWSDVGFSSTRLGLAGIESRGQGFNSVLFEPVDDAEPAPPHPEEGCTCPCGCPAPGHRDDDGTPGWCDSCRMNIHVEAAKAAGEKE